jgi:predicted ferric reductase
MSLLLLTSVVALGALNGARAGSSRWPRFTISAMHRNLSLIALGFVIVHVATAIIDPYAGIRWLDAVLPFTGHYQPLWLGFGAIALDLFLAVAVSSLLRRFIQVKLWKGIHWCAYACWPVALVHGLGIGGADARIAWVRILALVCVFAVLAAVVTRISVRHPDTIARRDLLRQTR